MQIGRPMQGQAAGAIWKTLTDESVKDFTRASILTELKSVNAREAKAREVRITWKEPI
jgi:hypothetical protein